MRIQSEALVAASGVFIGSLIADIGLGDGIQADDVLLAAAVALVAASLQFWLARSRQP